MKKILFCLSLTVLVLNLFSCKDEDDELCLGTGGSLTGVWLVENGDELYDGLVITPEGRIERVRVSGAAYERTSDYAEGIITKEEGHSLGIKGVDSEGSARFEMGPVVRVYDGKYVLCERMYLTSSMVAGTEYGAYFVKIPELNPSMELGSVEHDERLMGEWVQPFGDGRVSFASSYVEMTGMTVIDWCTQDGEVYFLYSYYGHLISSAQNYSIRDGKLTIGDQSYVRKEDLPKGDAGELGGLWLKTDSKMFYYRDGTMFGLKIDADGNTTNPRVSTELNVDESNVRKELVITSAKDGAFTAESNNGTVKGTYRIDTMMVFQSNTYLKLVHLQILSSEYVFNLGQGDNSNTSFIGHYSRLLNADQSLYNMLDCLDSNLIGKWGHSFSGTRSGTEYLIFSSDGTVRLFTDYTTGTDTNTYYYWGTESQGESAAILRMRLETNPTDANEGIYSFHVVNNTLYLRPQGEDGYFVFLKY